MKIYRMAASFGKLSNAKIELGENLNIVQAPNEAGKSTWCAFIRTMLYGINTSDRDKTGYISDKNRYQPWNDASMSGSMTVSWNGQLITLERLSKPRQPFGVFSAVYENTSQPVEGLTSSDAGELLTGMSSGVFTRSAFIRQSDMAVSQTPELEKRISSLISSGDESNSYTDVDKKLRDWMRKRLFKTTGLIPRCEQELEEIDEKLASIEDRITSLAELREKLQQAQIYHDECTAELAMHDKADHYDVQLQLYNAYASCMDLKERCIKMRDRLSASGISDKESLYALRYSLNSLTELPDESPDLAAKAERERLNKISESLKLSRFSPMSASDAEAAVSKASSDYRQADIISSPPAKSLLWAAVLSLVLFVSCGVYGVLFSNLAGLIAAGALAALSLVLYILYFRRKKISQKNQKLKASVLSGFGVSTLDELYSKLGEYKQLLYQSDSASVALAAAEEASKNAAEETRTAKNALFEKLRSIDANVTFETASPLLSSLEQLWDEYSDLATKAKVAAQLYESLSQTHSQDPDFDPQKTVSRPPHSRAELSSSLRYSERELNSLRSSVASIEGELRTTGDPLVLQSRRSELVHTLENAKKEHSAITLAIQTLSEANTEIQNRFSPLLGQAAADIFSRLTSGKYSHLFFDKSLHAKTVPSSESASRDSLLLSDGTLDQLYFSLRLAICELTQPDGSEPCPLILDDALMTFDRARMEAALELLLELSQKRQIILFTCHGREAEYLSGRDGVTFLSI